MTHSEAVRDPDRLWQRVRQGLATAVLGRLPEAPGDLQLLRVSCEVAPAALRPLLEARRLTEAILGEARQKPERARSRRRTLFGDTPERATEAVVVDLWNQLAHQAGARFVMVFDAVEQADEATLAALVQIVRRPAEWMRLPLVLVFHGEPKDHAAELLAAVRARGDDGVIGGEEIRTGEAQAIAWTTLPPEVLRVLRAGALIGPGFETRIVADLLGLEPLAVLELMQRAADLGVPIEDRGEGRFSLPTDALTALSASLLPSLAQAWHRHLGRLLGARAGEQARKPPPLPANRPRREQIASPGEALVTEILDLSEEVIDLVAEGEEVEAALDVSGDMSSGTLIEEPQELSPETRAESVAQDGASAGVEVASADMYEGASAAAGQDVSIGTGVEGAAQGRSAGAASTDAPASSGASAGVSRADDMSSGTSTHAGPPSGASEAASPAADLSSGTVSPPAEPAAAGDDAAAKPARRKTIVAPTVWAAAPPAEPAPAGGETVRPLRRKTVIAPSVRETEPAAAAQVEPAVAVAEAGHADAVAAPTRLEEPLIDEARAAEHLRLAGEYDAAAQHLCEAARKAADMGAPQAAQQHASSVLAMLATLPPSATRRALKVRALIELGRLQWHSAGYDLGFTLAQAQATLESARAELDPDAPVELAAELAETIAGVCFDLGDPRSLERALAELGAAGQMLASAGDAVGAACLLNDQAAVLIRMNDPGRALQLLRQSRKAFGAPVQDDPIALREFAETEHLFASLPLYAQLRPGREDEGYAMGLDHALAAERAYRELGEVRELGRVWETMGRLELRRGRFEAATQRLESALEVQTQLGDLTGLAQTSEALAQARAQSGREAEALALLRDAVVHSRDKGSPLGLTLARKAFDALAGRLVEQPEHAAGLQEVAILLTAGERELGLSQPAAEAAPA